MSDACVDCGAAVADGPDEWYMVHDDVWAQSGLGPDDGCLCIACLQARLGRALTPTDFPPYPVNRPDFGWPTARIAHLKLRAALRNRVALWKW